MFASPLLPSFGVIPSLNLKELQKQLRLGTEFISVLRPLVHRWMAKAPVSASLWERDPIGDNKESMVNLFFGWLASGNAGWGCGGLFSTTQDPPSRTYKKNQTGYSVRDRDVSEVTVLNCLGKTHVPQPAPILWVWSRVHGACILNSFPYWFWRRRGHALLFLNGDRECSLLYAWLHLQLPTQSASVSPQVSLWSKQKDDTCQLLRGFPLCWVQEQPI